MDILGMKRKEVEEMSCIEFTYAMEYSWLTYTERRVGYNLAQAFKEEKSSSGFLGNGIQARHPNIEKYIRDGNKEDRKPQFFKVGEEV